MFTLNSTYEGRRKGKMCGRLSITSLLKTAAAFVITAVMVCSTIAVPVYADVTTERVFQCDKDSIAQVRAYADAQDKATYQSIVRKDYKCWLQAVNANGKVKWSTSNKKVVKILSKNNQECEVMPLKDGKATITAKADNITIEYKLIVKSGKNFLNAWCKQWVKDHITEDMDFKEKLILASAYVVSNNNSYGNTSEPEDVITTGIGNCVSGGKLVACLCQAMGFDAKVRFAANDDMSRYPANIIFMEQHHNVEVDVDGKKYYIDGTPGGMMFYLCTKKKTLYYGYAVKNKIYPPDAFMDIPVEELIG